MRRTCLLFVSILFLPLGTTAVAQNHQHGGVASPYQGMEDREIKALSPDEIHGLLAGEGLGMALPAELNGYPGPRHVLDMATDLGLDDTERARVQAIYEAMHEEAVALGRKIVDREQALNDAFATSAIDESGLESLIAEIGELRIRLRTAHLRAHLETASVLEPGQRRHYQMLRGYESHQN